MPRKKIVRTKSHTLDVGESWARQRPDLDPADYLYLIYIMRLGRVLDKLDDQSSRQRFGISGADLRVLFALRRTGPPYALRPTDLFRALLVTSGAVSKQVDRLSEQGLVMRLPDPMNAGGFLVALTKSGIKMADEAIGRLTGLSPVSANDKLSREEREAFSKLCEKFLLILEEGFDED